MANNMRVNTNYHTRVRNIVLEMQAGAGGSTKHAETAKRLETPRMIKLHGDVNGSVMFDGSENAYISTSIDRITENDIKKIVDLDPSVDQRITEDEIDQIIDIDPPQGQRITEYDIDQIVDDDQIHSGVENSRNSDNPSEEEGEGGVRIDESEIDAIING